MKAVTQALVKYEADRGDREAFVAIARATFAPGERRSCEVCSKYKSLTHAHHLIPLSIQARYRSIADHSHVWLCPTHHAAVHFLIGQADSAAVRASRACINLVAEISSMDIDEFRAVLEIADRAWQ